MFAPSRRAPLLATAICAAVLAGCGSHTFTKRDYVARANAICASTLRSLRAAGPSSGLVAYLGSAVPVLQSEARQLRALPSPTQGASDRTALAHYLAAVEADVRSFEALQRAAQSGNAQGATDAEAALRASPTTTLAARYGLQTCAAPAATVT